MNSLDKLINLHIIRQDQLEKINEVIKSSIFSDSYCYRIIVGQLDEGKSFSYALRHLRITLLLNVLVGDKATSDSLKIRRIINFLYEEHNVTMDEIDEVVEYCATVLPIHSVVVFEDLEYQYINFSVKSFEQAFNQLKYNVSLMENEG